MNFYIQIKSMMKKWELTKYLKSVVSVKPRVKTFNIGGLTVQVRSSKKEKVGVAGGSSQTLWLVSWLVSYVHKKSEESDDKYREYTS